MLQNQNLSESISKQKDWDLRTSGTSPVVGSWPTSRPGPEDDGEALLPVAWHQNVMKGFATLW